jgi:TolB-like protein
MSFFTELKRRNVVRASIAYVLVAWLLLSVADFGLDLIDAPNWVIQALFLVAAIGLPAVMLFSWVFEMTPEGLKKESEIDRSQSITPQTGQKLNRAIIALLVLVAVYFIWEARFAGGTSAPDEASGTAIATAKRGAEATPVSANQAGSTAPRNAIAVLPFANRSNQETDLFFTDGIHDDLLTQLAKLGGMKVISRTSVMSYRDTDKKIPEIAAELGVGTILEGGVQRAGSQIRINAQLIDVATDEHLWAETFNREMTMDNIFDIQSEITRQIVLAVRGQLTVAEESAISARPTDNLGAWEAYLQARSIIRAPDYSRQKYDAAEPWARRAVELDPKFAQAWAMLAEIQVQGVWMGHANTLAQRELAASSLQRATELAPGAAEVMAARADYLYRIDNNYPKALEVLEQALVLEPGNAEIVHAKAVVERRLGLWTQAMDSFRRTLALDPANIFAAETMVETLAMMNDWPAVQAEARAWSQRFPESGDMAGYLAEAVMHHDGDLDAAQALLEGLARSSSRVARNSALQHAWYRRDFEGYRQQVRDRDDAGIGLALFEAAQLHLGASYILEGQQETGRGMLRDYIEKTAALEPVGLIVPAFTDSTLAEAHALLGEMDSALAYAARAEQRLPMERDHVFGIPINSRVILVRAMAGQRDWALQAIAERLDRPGGFSRWRLYLDPAWDFFRDDPRFNELVRPQGVEPEAFGRQSTGGGT